MELKPCPFCGSDAKFFPDSIGTDSENKAVLLRFIIGCSECRVAPPGTDGKVEMSLKDDGNVLYVLDEREAAISAWNRRAE